MSDAQITVIGGERFAATMHAAGRKIENLRAANAEVAKEVERAARQRAPKRTGRLARSIVGRAGNRNNAEIGSTLIYAPVIHNGWPRHHITANPFLIKGAEASQDQWMGTYQEHVQDALDTVKGA